MNTLRQFSEQERQRDLYRRRVDFLRNQKTMERLLEEERELKEVAIEEKEAALASLARV